MRTSRKRFNKLRRNPRKNSRETGKKIRMNGRKETITDKVSGEEAAAEVEVNDHFKFDIVIIKYIILLITPFTPILLIL